MIKLLTAFLGLALVSPVESVKLLSRGQRLLEVRGFRTHLLGAELQRW